MPLGMRDPALSKAFSCKTIACGYRYTPQESPARVRPSQPSAAAGPGNIRIWRLGAPRGYGQSLNISQKDIKQWVKDTYLPVVKEVAKGRAMLAMPSWLFTCLLFLASATLVFIVEDATNRSAQAPQWVHTTFIVLRIALASLAGASIVQGIITTFRKRPSSQTRVGIVVWPDEED